MEDLSNHLLDLPQLLNLSLEDQTKLENCSNARRPAQPSLFELIIYQEYDNLWIFQCFFGCHVFSHGRLCNLLPYLWNLWSWLWISQRTPCWWYKLYIMSPILQSILCHTRRDTRWTKIVTNSYLGMVHSRNY